VAELWSALDGSAAMARMAGTTISRAYNVLVSLVLTSIALAIPLTANMYTPKLIDIFIKDRVNLTVLTFFVLSSAQAIWSAQATWDQGALKDVGGAADLIVDEARRLAYYHGLAGTAGADAAAGVLAGALARLAERATPLLPRVASGLALVSAGIADPGAGREADDGS
jgi:hypothetical protein